jgi:hypothetical protein
MSRQREELDRLEEKYRVFRESPGAFTLWYAARPAGAPRAVSFTSQEVLDEGGVSCTRA